MPARGPGATGCTLGESREPDRLVPEAEPCTATTCEIADERQGFPK
jgi:hypothetical protein